MYNSDDYVTAVQSIVDTTVDANLWGEALDNCVKFVGARSSVLVLVDNDNNSVYRPRYLSKVFSEKSSLFDEYMKGYASLEKEAWDTLELHPAQDILTDDGRPAEIYERPDFVFLREHYGVDRRMICRVNDNPAWSDAITFQFDKELDSRPSHSKYALKSLLPIISTALQVGRNFHILQKHYKAALAALNHVKIGLFITDSNGQIIFANAEAERILQRQDGMSISPKKKLTVNKNLQAEYDSAISRAYRTAKGEVGKTTHQFLIERRSGDRSWLLEVTPLRDALGEIDRDLSGALVSIIDPDNQHVFDIERFGNFYKLTRTEKELCRLMLEGHNNNTIAEHRNVSPSTVKNQINKLNKKLGVQSRVGIIRRIVLTVPPIHLGA